MNAWSAPVGLPAAALSAAALHCASLVALVASHPNAFTAAPAAASPPLPLPLAAYDRFLDVCRGFGGAAALALLRAGSSPMLLLIALGGGCDAAAVAALSLLLALLQACLAPWVAVQLSALTVAAQCLAQGRHRAAYDLLSSALCLALALALAAALWLRTADAGGAGRGAMLGWFGKDSRLLVVGSQLLWYLPPLLLLKAASGLLGSFLSATGYGREVGMAYAAFHWLLALPAACAALYLVAATHAAGGDAGDDTWHGERLADPLLARSAASVEALARAQPL